MRSTFVLGDWQVSPEDGSLTGRGTRIRLEPQIMALLLYLCERPCKVVSKNEILDNVWKSRYVSDETLKSAFFNLRRALADDSREPRYIETIPKRGYRMLVRPSGVAHDDLALAQSLLEGEATPSSLAQARAYLERAASEHSHDARVHAGLARALLALAMLDEDPGQALPAAAAAAEKALEIDPDFADAHAVTGMLVFLREDDPVRAEASFRRALARESHNITALIAYARFLTMRFRHAEAVENARTALECDPLSVSAERELIDALFMARRYDETLAQARHLLERHPGANDIFLGMTFVHYLMGEQRKAYTAFVGALEHMHVQDRVLTGVRTAFASGGMKAVFELWLQMLEREALLGRRVQRDAVALHALLGQNDECFAVLAHACAERAPYVRRLAVSPLLDGLRGDPRFSQLFPNR